MAYIVNQDSLSKVVTNAIKGITDRVVKEETEIAIKASERIFEDAKNSIQRRLFQETSDLMLKVVQSQKMDSMHTELSIVVVDK